MSHHAAQFVTHIHTTRQVVSVLRHGSQRVGVTVLAPRSHRATVVGVRGPGGPTGATGSSVALRTAGPALSALRVVWEDALGQVWPLSADDSAHMALVAGLTLSAAGAGGQVQVQRSGVLDAAGLGLVPGRVWLGAGGQLTQAAPSAGFDLLVGHAVAGGRMYLTFDDAINLED